MHRVLTLLGAAVLLNSIVATPASAALATYTYSGNFFSDDADASGQPDFPFTTLGRAFGTFTMDCTGIGSGDCANLPLANYTANITSFDFSVLNPGFSLALTDENQLPGAPGAPSFQFSTNGSREMLVWTIGLISTECSTGVILCGLVVDGGSTGQFLPPADTATALFLNLASASATSTTSGTFTVSAVPLPLPLALLLPCLAAMVPMIRRRPAG
jgi:hypothetical protein